MAYTYEELKGKTVAQLREIAERMEEEKDHEQLHGFSTMHKAELLHALCEVLGIEEHVHHEVIGIDKAAIKRKIRELKAERDAALQAEDFTQLKFLRRRIRGLKRKIRKATI